MKVANISWFAATLIACGQVTLDTNTDPDDDIVDPDDPIEDPAPVPECAANTVACRDGALETCDAAGFVATSESCELGCVDANVVEFARCATIEPAFIPNVCDSPAQSPSLVTPVGQLTLNTDDDATCTGGLVPQSNNVSVCVVRANVIEIHDVEVTGRRPIAFVADASLEVKGTLDVSANGIFSGPGVARVSGMGTTQGGGGGGAGFAQPGATGGGNEFGVRSGDGGAVFDPIGQPFMGGAKASSLRVNQLFPVGAYAPSGGGGGGGVMLVACRGAVSVSGTIDASGGGGGAGGDTSPSSSISPFGGAGGGSGGYVVMQAAQVVVTGSLFANGGGGGGGCATDNCIGQPGKDGKGLSGTGAGGGASGSGAAGGSGGFAATRPVIGSNDVNGLSPGGGGGSTGRFQVFVPAGVTPTLTPAIAEPAFEATRTIATR